MLARSFFLVAVLATTSTPAVAQHVLDQTEVLDCTVTDVEGGFSSFVPPQVGHTIRFDLAEQEIGFLAFSSGNPERFGSYIPASGLTKILSESPWHSHQAFYREVPQPFQHDSTMLTLGAYNPGTGELSWEALIQKAYTPEFGPWHLDTLRMRCELASILVVN